MLYYIAAWIDVEGKFHVAQRYLDNNTTSPDNVALAEARKIVSFGGVVAEIRGDVGGDSFTELETIPSQEEPLPCRKNL